jgi:4'-phosphopantetheinyl transferase
VSAPPDEVHLWLAPVDSLSPSRIEAAWDLLDAAERARADRFLVEEARTLYVVAHALARTALAERAGADPRDFEFRAASRGKPEIAAPAEHSGLRFNLSHTSGLCACAVARGGDVGVDVERGGDRFSLADIARRVFTAAEFERFERAAGAEQRALFLALWTAKEAFMKATGEGFHLSPGRLDVDLDEGDGVRDARLDGLTLFREWHFRRFRPTPDHAGALVARRLGPSLDVVPHLF